MQETVHRERMLTELDFARLRKLPPGAIPDELADLLNEAELLDPRSIPADAVTMNAQVEIEDVQTHHRQTLTICYPHDAQPATGRISVLSPVGVALLGLRVGATARWTTPTGEEKTARVTAVLFQPEASGDYLA